MEEILNGREERRKAKNEFITNFNSEAAISFLTVTINRPGSNKNSSFVKDLFSEALRMVSLILPPAGLKILKTKVINNQAGPAGLLAIRSAANQVKKLCIQIEQNHFAGRLFDLDVSTGEKIISRTQLGFPPRKCFLCDQAARKCRREGKHTKEEIENWISNQRANFYQAQHRRENLFAERIEEIIYWAIREEVKATPKPGLVDRENCGSHSDMNFSTFEQSSRAIKGYFSQFVKTGMDLGLTAAEILPELRKLGRKAERDMLQATGGVNTQKGIIFCLGLLAAAVGHFYKLPKSNFTADLPSSLANIVAEWTAGITDRELKENELGEELTNGQRVYKKYGVTGARGEVETGFSHVLNYGLPVFKKARAAGRSRNFSSVQALVSIMGQLNDTNILSRSNLEVLQQVKQLARQVIDAGGVDSKPGNRKLNKLIDYVEKKEVSPGGAADLLAITLFFYKLEVEWEKLIKGVFKQGVEL